MTKDEHFDELNRRLSPDAGRTMAGAMCLAFSTVALMSGHIVTTAQMDDLMQCASLSEGLDLAEIFWGKDFHSRPIPI